MARTSARNTATRTGAASTTSSSSSTSRIALLGAALMAVAPVAPGLALSGASTGVRMTAATTATATRTARAATGATTIAATAAPTSPVTAARKPAAGRSAAGRTGKNAAAGSTGRKKRPPSTSYTDDEENDGGDFEVSDFRELQQMTGSEILQSELQAQIDEAMTLGGSGFDPNSFLERQAGKDATDMEKIAMSSVTEQLPQRAVRAFARQRKQRKQKQLMEEETTASTAATDGKRLKSTSKVKRHGLNSVSGDYRVTPEREVALARTIQRGAALQSVRRDLADELGRPPTKQEWADRAGVSSSELRRQVSDYRVAKHELVTANLGLVHAVVNQQWNQFGARAARAGSGMTKEELVQEGSLGLLRAAELFDPSRGLRFSTYAVVWIKGTLSNTHVPELVKVPGREKTKYNKIVKAQRDLEQLGEKAAPEKVAEMTGMSVEQVMVTERRMSQSQRVLSLDQATVTQSRSGTESSTQLNGMEKDKALQADVDLAERTQMQADIIAAMARNLDDREGRLMRLRYGLSDGRARSLQECADAMGISYTRVHQLATRCLKKLREAAEVEALEEYLLTIA